MIGSMFVIQFPYKNRTSGEESQNMRVFYISGRLTFFNLYSTFRHHINQVGDCFSAEATRKMNIYIYIYLVGGGEETRSGTEKRCSHNLQSCHPAWWSADNGSIFPTVINFRLVRSKKRTGRRNQKCLKN